MADKLDLVFKKVVNRQYTSAVKEWYEENPGIPFKLKGSDVWIDNIPETPPSVDSAVVKGWRITNKLQLTKDTTVNNNQGWYAEEGGSKLTGFISPRYGQGYTARLFVQGGAEIPTTHSSGWFFDYESGILTFDSSPPGSAFEIVVYQYIGSTADDLAEALEGSAWQDPVLSISDAPTGSEVGGERYLISSTPSGGSVFDGHAEEIAEFDGVNWKFSEPSSGKITYVISLDRLYVYDNNDGWAWSGIDSADLDYNNADSDLESLSVKGALDELDRLVNTITNSLYVDSARTDSYVETGTIIKPFKTLANAVINANNGDTLHLAAQSYDGAGIIIPNGVSILGDGVDDTTINGSITIGADSTSNVSLTLENINFGNNGNVIINNESNVMNIKCNGTLTLNSKCVGNNLDITGGSDALVINNGAVLNLTTVEASNGMALRHTGGKLILSTSKFVGSEAAAYIAESSGGTIETDFTSFLNNGGGKALNINNTALVDDPNKLYDTLHKGGIDCNDAVTIVEGVGGGNPTSTVADNANLIYRGGTQLKNDSTIIKDESGGVLIGKTLNDSIDRVANVTQYDQTHGFLLIEPCIDDIDIT